MDREIKFKFILDNKFLTEPYTLDEILEKSKEDIIIDLDNKYGDCNCLNEGCNHCECQSIFEDSKITGKVEFTGLKDKNGKDIYEGDLLQFNKPNYDKRPFKVEYQIDYLDGDGYKHTGYDCDSWDEAEVIGNVFENKDLLTK